MDLSDKCEILGDKVDAHMRKLERLIRCCNCQSERRLLEAERNAYLLDVSYLLASKDNEEDNYLKNEENKNKMFPDFVSLTSRGPSRSRLLNRYKIVVERSMSPDPTPSDTRSDEEGICPCGSTNVLIDEREAILICQTCALCRPYWSCSGNLSFNEEKHMVPEGNFAYQRINHLKELLAQIQGKQQTEIPEDILNSVRLELKKQRVTDIEKVTMAKVNKILRSLKLIKYYEHSNYICYLITGKQPLRMAPALENKLCSMFHEIQGPWEKHKPPERHNFLSYHYTLYQMCRLLNADEFLPCFSILKSSDKLHRTNMQWKKICEELNWEFSAVETY